MSRHENVGVIKCSSEFESYDGLKVANEDDVIS